MIHASSTRPRPSDCKSERPTWRPSSAPSLVVSVAALGLLRRRIESAGSFPAPPNHPILARRAFRPIGGRFGDLVVVRSPDAHAEAQPVASRKEVVHDMRRTFLLADSPAGGMRGGHSA